MKKLLVLLTLTVVLLMCLAACGGQSAHTHQYGEWTTTKTPTCTENGTKTRYCSCGEKQSDVIYAIGHKVEILPAKESTCVSTGLTEGKRCSECGEILVVQEEVSIQGHTETILPAVESTCTEKGLTEGKECSVCQTVLVAQESLPLKDHVEVIDAGVAATCTKIGLTEGKHCSVCNTVIVTRQEIPVVPHTYDDKYDESCNNCPFIRDVECNHQNTEVIAGKNATCTEIGYTNGSKCTKCGEIVVAQEVIEATGHGDNLKKVEAKDPTFDATGNYEYWKCSKCGKSYNDAKATNEIAESSTVIPVVPSYTITFVDRENQEDKTERYSQNASLFISNTPAEMVGYNFVGWYTTDGKPVDYISKGNAENYILYAKRDAIRYSITYVDAPINNNVKIYTIEEEVQLIDPEWIGLSFKNWTNANNEVVTKIDKGTIGNVTLRANWLSEENLATPTDDNEPEGVVFDETLNKYYFIYEMGVIDNIVLGIVESQDKSTMESLTFSKSNTITIENSIADTVAKTISESISKTNGWSESRDLAFKYSHTSDRSISAGLEVGGATGPKSKIEASIGVSDTFETGVTLDYGKHSSEEIGSTSEESVSATVAYAKGQSTTVTATSTIDGAMPKGTYRYVVVAKVTVYAIVTYDITTGNYYLDTYSVMDDDLRDKRLYQAPSDTTANITTNDALSFDIGNKDFKNYIDSSYYVKYDANGGRGEEMLLSVFSVNGEYVLSPNEYVRDGYTFSGWSLVKNDSANVYTDEDVVCNIANGGELVVLYAQWTPTPYKVQWNNVTGCTIKVERTSSPNGKASLGALSSGDTIYYGDKLVVTYTANTGYHFEVNSSYPTSITKEFVVTKAITATDITAKPIINTYTLKYDANGGSGSMSNVTHTYGSAKNLTKNSFSRHGWTFSGWKDQNGKTYTNGQQVNNLTTKHGDTITLYAQWELITVAVYNKDYVDVPSVGTFGGSGNISDLLDIAALINHGYKYRITIHYDLTVHGDHLYAVTSLETNKEIFNSGDVYYGHNATASPTYTITGNASDFRNNTYFEIHFDAKGMSFLDALNHFSVSNLKITIEFYK